jgi:hypothetical protein
MIVRRALPYLLALTLGIAAALLAACGSSTTGGIQQGDGSVLKGQLEDVRQRVADGQCDGLAAQLRDVDTAIDALPRSVDARLISALRNGSDRLQANAVIDCNDNRNAKTTSTQTQTTQTQTQTQTSVPTQTATTPTQTVPTETVPTETVAPPPPPAATVPTPTVPTPTTPAPAPPPPAANPGGGTPPQIP